jgi:threonine/homoserine/homoserine lactone efflux protein
MTLLSLLIYAAVYFVAVATPGPGVATLAAGVMAGVALAVVTP